LSNSEKGDEIPVNIKSDESEEQETQGKSQEEQTLDTEQQGPSYEELKELLEEERKKVQDYEGKVRQLLADYQNLQRKTQSDIQTGVNKKIDEFLYDFLQVYDDFVRAKQAYAASKIDTSGLDSILKNMDSLLTKYQVQPIEALGEIFDPDYHEAISVAEDPDLDDDTVTKEIRKGYISQNRVIRPALVEISKRPQSDNNKEIGE